MILDMLPGLDLRYQDADSAQQITTAGYDLDDLAHDLSDLSVDDLDHDRSDPSVRRVQPFLFFFSP